MRKRGSLGRERCRLKVSHGLLNGCHESKGEYYADGVLLVLPPIETKGMTPENVDELAQRTRDSMLKEIVALTSKHLGGAHDRHEASAVASGVDTGRQKVANAL